jgi:hypothetical protein
MMGGNVNNKLKYFTVRRPDFALVMDEQMSGFVEP